MLDSQIVAAVVAGDPEGLAAAYDRYAAPLYAFCHSLLNDQADAADAVQDTFIIASARLDRLRIPICSGHGCSPWPATSVIAGCGRGPAASSRSKPAR